MPYIGATELSLILPAHVSIGTNTDPLTLGEVGSIIAEVSGRLDGVAAAAGYSVPIASTATVAYAAVQGVVKDGVAARILSILFPNMGPGSKAGLSTDYRAAYDDAIKAIRAGEFTLVGAGRDTGETSRALPRSYGTSNSSDDAAQFAASPHVPMAWQP